MWHWLKFTIKGRGVPLVVAVDSVAAASPAYGDGTLLWLKGSENPFHLNEAFEVVVDGLDMATMEKERIVVDPETWKLLEGEEANPWRD